MASTAVTTTNTLPERQYHQSAEPSEARPLSDGLCRLRQSAISCRGRLVIPSHTGNRAHLRPFQWTATADQILEKVRRGRVTLNAISN
jgi:hypothetical protein